MLIPARTDTKAFRMLYEYGCLFQFVSGRLHFNDSAESAPFPSMFVTLIGGGKSEMGLVDKEMNEI